MSSSSRRMTNSTDHTRRETVGHIWTFSGTRTKNTSSCLLFLQKIKRYCRVRKFLNCKKIMTNELLIIIYLALNIHAKIYKYVKLHINFLGLFFSGAKVNQERPLTTVLGTR